MNYMVSLLTYSFVSSLVKLTWPEILEAIHKQFVPRNFAIDHAMAELAILDDYPQDLVDLASLNKDDDVHPHIDNLADMGEPLEKNEFNLKWMYLVLAWVYKNKDSYPDPLAIVEQVYADFDYPDNISGFVRYMPSDEPDLGSLEKNQARLYEKWEKFLDEQRAIYK